MEDAVIIKKSRAFKNRLIIFNAFFCAQGRRNFSRNTPHVLLPPHPYLTSHIFPANLAISYLKETQKNYAEI